MSLQIFARRRNWKTPYLQIQFLPLRGHSPFPLEGPISVFKDVTSVSHVNKKETQKYTVWEKFGTPPFKNCSTYCNSWLAISNVLNQHAHEVVLSLSKGLKINFILRVNTRFGTSDAFIRNTICAYHSCQDKVCEVFET